MTMKYILAVALVAPAVRRGDRVPLFGEAVLPGASAGIIASHRRAMRTSARQGEFRQRV